MTRYGVRNDEIIFLLGRRQGIILRLQEKRSPNGKQSSRTEKPGKRNQKRVTRKEARKRNRKKKKNKNESVIILC